MARELGTIKPSHRGGPDPPLAGASTNLLKASLRARCLLLRMSSRLPVISLFSGAGGLDLAVERCAEPSAAATPCAGPLTVAVATDYEQAALDTFHLNFPTVPTICRDIRTLPTKQLLKAAGL